MIDAVASPFTTISPIIVPLVNTETVTVKLSPVTLDVTVASLESKVSVIVYSAAPESVKLKISELPTELFLE